MAYQALYRRFRPVVFEDVVGQGSIVTTLKNQIKTSKISHAYLFSGTRGTGKTSTAKIFARAVNCLSPVDENPCNKCEVCRGIMTENIMDVLEIDAASNNGVDHIREIRENVKYPPSKGKYKVYIIDEVHMLSGGAFNALLKTLEEPPSHVIFILATTEPHKLPATILSRCQRFDFKPVKLPEIVGLLTRICQATEISFEEKALRVIAQNGKGSLRDSLSILEQCMGFSKGNLTYNEVINTLGLTDEEVLYQLAQAIKQRNPGGALEMIQSLIAEGKDVQLLIKDLITHFRQLLMLKLKVESDSFFCTGEIQEMLTEQSGQFTEEELTRCIYQLSDAEGKAKYAAQPQIILEVVIVTLCRPETENSLEALSLRIDALEAAIKNGNIKTAAAVNEDIHKTRQQLTQRAVKADEKNSSEAVVNNNEIKAQPPEAKDAPVSTSPPDLKVIQGRWNDILESLRLKKKAQIKAFLMEGQPVDLQGDRLVISFRDGFGFHREALDKDKNKEIICSEIMEITGQRVSLSFVMENQLGNFQPQEADPIDELKEMLPRGMLEIIEE